MSDLKHKTLIVGAVALLPLMAITAASQSPSGDLPRVAEIDRIDTVYTGDGKGRIRAAGKSGVVEQYLNIWEDHSKVPNLVTYVLLGGKAGTFSVTWGRGPVNRAAFSCGASDVPEFGEKSLWVVTVTDSILTFRELADADVKGLFDNLTLARRDWEFRLHPTYMANTTQRNILSFFNEKNRRKWLERGWLRPATDCVPHF